MKSSKYIDLKSLTMDELNGVVNLYPWYGAARKELFLRLLDIGGEVSETAFADASMFVASRRSVAMLFRDRTKKIHTDKDAEKLLKTYIAPTHGAGNNSDNSSDASRRVYVVGGDYFSQEQYDKVKGDESFGGFRIGRHSSAASAMEVADSDGGIEIYTETMAQIYAEQGYYEQAKRIYSKLLLADPKKNTYFAALIENLEQNQSTI